MSTKRKKEANTKTPKKRSISSIKPSVSEEANTAAKKAPIMEIRCKCNRECKKLDIPFYQDLFVKFHEIPSKDLQGTYLLGLIHVRRPLRRYKNANEDSAFKRQVSVLYTVPTEEGTHFAVCRSTFGNIFGISRKVVETLTEKKKAGNLAYIDQRGKYDHKRKSNENDVELIKEQMNLFWNDITQGSSEEYTGGNLSIRRLFEEFKEMHPDSAITFRAYHKTLKTEFPQLKFGKTKQINFQEGEGSTITCTITDF